MLRLAQMPNLSTNGWDALVHQVVWKVGRHFGFQAFNVNPRTKELVRAATAVGHGQQQRACRLPLLLRSTSRPRAGARGD